VISPLAVRVWLKGASISQFTQWQQFSFAIPMFPPVLP